MHVLTSAVVVVAGVIVCEASLSTVTAKLTAPSVPVKLSNVAAMLAVFGTVNAVGDETMAPLLAVKEMFVPAGITFLLESRIVN